VLIARGGGTKGEGSELEAGARDRGLRVGAFDTESNFCGGLAEQIRDGADVISLRFGVTPCLARTLYAAADGVLANSVSEPFGLVGLEAMAAGGVVITGGTGEDYAIHGRNALVLQSLDPDEIVARWEDLEASPDLGSRLRRSAKRTARGYRWRDIVAILVDALTRQARRQGCLPPTAAAIQVGAYEPPSRINIALQRPPRRAKYLAQ
jgi:glycosyltransferase involved in cell wall biosynthesis